MKPTNGSWISLVLWFAAVVTICTATGNAQVQKKTIRLSSLAQSPRLCEDGIEVRFFDNEHLLLSNPICQSLDYDSSYQIAIISLDGTLNSSVYLSNDSRYPYVGPNGTILVPGGEKGWLIFDATLHQLGSIPTQAKESEGCPLPSSSGKSVALVFTGADGYSPPYRYVVLSGHPLEKIAELTSQTAYSKLADSGVLQEPSKGICVIHRFTMANGEQWYFDEANGEHLTREVGHEGAVALTDADWLSKREENLSCSAEVSSVDRRRLLAHCWGTTSPFGRALPVGWGHNRFAVYDLEGRVVLKQEIPLHANVALSPDGHRVAVTDHGTVDVYPLD